MTFKKKSTSKYISMTLCAILLSCSLAPHAKAMRGHRTQQEKSNYRIFNSAFHACLSVVTIWATIQTNEILNKDFAKNTQGINKLLNTCGKTSLFIIATGATINAVISLGETITLGMEKLKSWKNAIFPKKTVSSKDK